MGNPVVKYDKAKWHYEGEWPSDLPESQAFVHTGMFLGWIIDKELYSEEFAKDSKKEIAAFKKRKMTGTQVYMSMDGSFCSYDVNTKGHQFTQAYFDFEKGDYLRDYVELLASDLPNEYYVEDTWENYDKLKVRIDKRFKAWDAAKIKKKSKPMNKKKPKPRKKKING